MRARLARGQLRWLQSIFDLRRAMPHRGKSSAVRLLVSSADAAPDRLALIQVPRTTDERLDALEAKTRSAFDLARRARPNLRVKLLPPLLDLLGGRAPDDIALVVVLHEHLWVGGECVRGCGEAPA